ncbi:MAG TPA: HAD family hydrolase [Thermoanaerobaculia bacterium]|nr:HAD family hydrolase [Thermoanaerobaculia bacterium]
MNQRAMRAVLFDWDGTLVDSAESTYRVYVRLFADYGIAFDRDVFRRTYSPAWHNTYRDLGLPEDRWKEADAKWMRYFAEETTNLMSGAAEALQMLTGRGIVCGIVTSGTRRRIVRELVDLGVHHHFAHVVCGDDGHAHKPHPEALAACLERLEVAPAEAAYVGDTAEDMMMARAAGVFSVGVFGPFPNHDSLRAATPDLIADTLTNAVRHLVP